jgi:hypothetical protein
VLIPLSLCTVLITFDRNSPKVSILFKSLLFAISSHMTGCSSLHIFPTSISAFVFGLYHCTPYQTMALSPVNHSPLTFQPTFIRYVIHVLWCPHLSSTCWHLLTCFHSPPLCCPRPQTRSHPPNTRLRTSIQKILGRRNVRMEDGARTAKTIVITGRFEGK